MFLFSGSLSYSKALVGTSIEEHIIIVGAAVLHMACCWTNIKQRCDNPDDDDSTIIVCLLG